MNSLRKSYVSVCVGVYTCVCVCVYYDYRHDGEDLESYQHWLTSIRPGSIIRHPVSPFSLSLSLSLSPSLSLSLSLFSLCVCVCVCVCVL